MLTLLPKLLSHWKMIGIGIIVVMVGCYIFLQQREINAYTLKVQDLQDIIDTLTVDKSNLEGEIKAYQANQEIQSDQQEKVQDLLAKCYLEMTAQAEDMKEIDKIMETPETSTTVTQETTKETTHVTISSTVNTSGLEFINRQLANVK